MKDGIQINLTSTEIAQLWTQFMNDSGSICILTYFLEKVEDGEVKPIVAHALELSQSHIQKITAILTDEKYVIPHGFKLEEDVDLNAPRLYSDIFILNFLHNMSKVGLTLYSESVMASIRSDITDYYSECLTETIQLYKMTKDLLLIKGLYIRPPYFLHFEEVEFVHKEAFLKDIFGEKRPLLAIEIANLYSNIRRNHIGMATLIGFGQVAKSKEVTQFLKRCIEIGRKNITIFAGKLEKSNLPVPMSWDSDVSKSMDYTFSDRLMMFYTAGLISLSVGYYGTAIAESPRVDLGVMYNRLSLEIQKLSEDGMSLMIKNKWFEQPPIAPDRDELLKKKK